MAKKESVAVSTNLTALEAAWVRRLAAQQGISAYAWLRRTARVALREQAAAYKKDEHASTPPGV